MAANMDERVVSMEFDNKQFEKNVKTSMKTIDDLKESLDFDKTGESFDKLTDSFKKFGKENVFKDVDGSVSTLRRGIGLLGDSAGGMISQFMEITKVTAMFEAAKKAVQRLESAVKQFTIQPINEGLKKYETKIGSIKTIANATNMAAEDVNTSLDRLNWFTDETSASFDSMVQNIGKFTSVGKGLDESITAMQGIATWGYHSGASVAEQTRAMYNLSQALGTGSVKLIDWKSIENAGMATKEFKEQAIAAAEAAGELTRKGDKLFTKKGKKEEVTVENFNSTLQKGWFTSDVLMDVLKEYGSFADKVRKYQEEHPQYALASEAMEAMDKERLDKQNGIYNRYLDSWSKNAKKSSDKIKEDVAKINKIASVKDREKEIREFAKKIGMSYEETKKVLDDLAETEESLGEKAFKSSQEAKTFQEAIDATKDAVSTGWMNTFQYLFGGLDKSVELWSDVTEILWDLFAAGAEFRNNAFMHWAEEFNGWADLWNADEEAGPLGALRNLMNTIIDLKDLLGSSFKNVFFPALANVTGDLSMFESWAPEGSQNGMMTTDQIKHWREGNYMGYQIKKVTSGIREFTAKINEFFTNEDNLEKIGNIFTAIATAVQFALGAVKSFFSAINNFVTKSGIFQDILNVLSAVANKVTEVFNKIKESGFIQKLFGKISNGFLWFYNLVKGWITQIKEFFDETGIGKAISDWFNGIVEWFTGSEKDVDENGQKTESGFFRAFGWLKNVKEWFDGINLKETLYSIKDTISHLGDVWSAFVNALNGGGVDQEKLENSGLSTNVQSMILKANDFGKKLSGVWNFIKGIYDKIVAWLESSGILPALRNFFGDVKLFFDNIGLIWNTFVNGKQVDPKQLNEKQLSLVAGIQKFINKVQSVFGKIKLIASNLGTIWQVFTDALNGKKYLPKVASTGGEMKASPLTKILIDVGAFGNKLSGAWNSIKGTFNKITGWLESSGILPALRGFWENVKAFFGNIGLIWDTFVNGKKVDPKQLDEKQRNLLAGISKFINSVKSVWGKIKSWFEGAWAWVVDKWNLFVGWLESSGILPTIRNLIAKIKITLSNFKDVWSAFTSGLSGRKIDKKELKNSGMDENLQKIVEDVWGFGNRINDAVQKVKDAWNKAKEWLESSGILPTLRSWWSAITEWFENVKKDIEENGVFQSVSNFFTDLGEKIKGLFGGLFGGGNESAVVELPSIEITGGETGKDGLFSSVSKAFGADDENDGFFTKLINGFKNKEGNFDLLAGIGSGITGLIQTIGSMNWTTMSADFFGIFVNIINGLNDALGKIHYENIVKVFSDIVGAATGVLIVKGITDVSSTIRTIVKKGNDKSLLEQFADLLSTVGDVLLKIGISVALIAGSIWVLSTIKPDDLNRSVGVMIGIGVFLAGMIVAIGLMTKSKTGNVKEMEAQAKSFQAMGSILINIGLAVGIIVASIAVMAGLLATGANIGGAIAIVAGIMVAMVVIIKIMSNITKDNNTVRISAGIAVFAGMAILIGAITVCLILLQGLNWGKALADLLLLALAMAGIVAAMKILDKVKISPKTLSTIIVMAVIIGLITAAFLLLKDADPLTIGVIAIALGGVVLAMAGAMKIMETLGPGAIKGALIFSAALVIIIAGIAAAAAIASGAAERVTNAIVVMMSNLAAASNSAKLVDMQAIKDALSVLDKIVFALATTWNVNTSNAIKVADAAWDVFNELSLATTAAMLVEEKQFEKIFGKDGNGGLLQLIQTGMSSVTTTGWKASALGRSVETLAENLKLIGQAGVTLSTAVDDKGNTYEKGIQTVKEQLTAIREIVNIAEEMGTIGEGEDAKQFDLTSFSEGIANVGAALELYNTALGKAFKEARTDVNGDDITGEIKTISTETISGALTSVLSAMKGVTFDKGEIENIESWAGLSTGTGGETLFALGLINVANAMDAFSNSATNFNDDNVGTAIGSLDKLADIKAKFETNSPADYQTMMAGVALWGDGGDFKTAISGMGTAIAAFGTSVKDLPSGSVQKATDALDTLAVIYEKLKGEGSVEAYMLKIGDLVKVGGVESTTDSVTESFTDFGAGIGKLGEGLGTFSRALTDEEIGYDQDKVDAAVKILENMSAIQTNLQSVNVDGQWWYALLFGENGIKKLGENLSSLGSRLSTFSQELATAGGFDIDVNSNLWKNISGVITYFADIQKEMLDISQSEETYNAETGQMTSGMIKAGQTISDLANGINNIREPLLNFSKAMTDTYEITNANGQKERRNLGDWSSTTIGNVTTLLNALKDITIEFKNAGLEEGKFYDLDAFGYDLSALIGKLNGSSLSKLMNSLEAPEGADKLTAFATSIKSLVDATVLLQSQSIDANSVKEKLGSVITAIMGLDGVGVNLSEMDTSAMQLAAQFINGFAKRMAQVETTEGENGTAVSGAMQSILDVIAGFTEDFYAKGKTAGEQYASGFNAGLAGMNAGNLTPIIDMDAQGAAAGRAGLTAALAAMSDSIGIKLETVLGTRLDSINARFDKTIDVKDHAHIEILKTINSKLGDLEKLRNIKNDVETLKGDVKNLEVYMDTGKLVGAIAPEMNRALGSMTNVS